jgi:hypothetical protein
MSFDLSISRGGAGEVQEFRISNPELVTGPLKLWHKYAVSFLTIPGTATFEPDLGSSFLPAMGQGLIRTESDINNRFNLAASEAEFFIKSNQEDDIPEDEELITSSLRDSGISDSERLSLEVLITTADGAQRIIDLPVSTQEEIRDAN